MIVAVNTRLLIKNKMDGIGRFAFETLKRITKNNPEVEFHFIFDRPFSSDFIFSDNIIPHIISPKTQHPILWYIWLELKLPKLINKINPDLFFSPDGFMPTKCSVPSIITIHDINFEHEPTNLGWAHSWFYRNYFKQYAQLSSQIITVSNFSKQDIITQYKINDTKINVVYNGVSDIFFELSENIKRKTKEKYSNGEDFFIFIGSLHKRKNIHNLLLAFEKYRQSNGTSKLLIIGENKWIDKHTKHTYQRMIFKKEVVFLGHINDIQLPKILGSATALCFVSFFEGFGLPIVEAMKSCVPVITSNTSCMPEIAKDSAFIVDPHNIEEISDAMLNLEKNKNTRLELIKKGEIRSKEFNWGKSANKIWTILKETYKKHESI